MGGHRASNRAQKGSWASRLRDCWAGETEDQKMRGPRYTVLPAFPTRHPDAATSPRQRHIREWRGWILPDTTAGYVFCRLFHSARHTRLCQTEAVDRVRSPGRQHLCTGKGYEMRIYLGGAKCAAGCQGERKLRKEKQQSGGSSYYNTRLVLVVRVRGRVGFTDDLDFLQSKTASSGGIHEISTGFPRPSWWRSCLVGGHGFVLLPVWFPFSLVTLAST